MSICLVLSHLPSGFAIATVLVAMSHRIGALFTDDREVWAAAAEIAPLLAAAYLSTCSGGAMSCGGGALVCVHVHPRQCVV